MDIGSDSTSLNGLNDGVFNDIVCDSIEVGENMTVSGNVLVGGDIVISGRQIYSGTATYNNAVEFNGPIYGLTGGTGILYDPDLRTISNTDGSLWSLTASDKIINQSGKTLALTREGPFSKIIMNYGATGSNRVGIFYNDNNNVSAEYPLITTGSLGDQINFETPNNQGKCLIRMKPMIGSSPADDSYVVLTRPDSDQTIDASLALGLGHTFTSSYISVGTGLFVYGQDYRSLFSATGGLLSYNGTGEYALDSSTVQGLFSSSNNGLSITAGVITSIFDANSVSIFPRSGAGIEQLCLGFTGSGDELAGIHVKSDSGRSSLLLESTTGSWDPIIRLKNSPANKTASLSYYSSTDTINLSPSTGVETVQVSPNLVKVRAGSGNSATFELSTGIVQSELICDPSGNLIIIPSGNTIIDQGTLTVNNSCNFGSVTSKGQTVNNVSNDSSGAFVTLQKVRGTANTLSGDVLGYISANGYNNSAYRQAGYIAFSQSAAGSSNAPADIVFATANTSDSNAVERMRLSRAGNLGIGSSIFSNPQYPLHIATSETSGIVSVCAQFAAQLPPNTSGNNRVRNWLGVNTNIDNSYFQDFYFYSNDGGTNSRFNYVGWGAAQRGYSFLSNGNGTFYIPSLGGSGNQYVGVDTNGTLYKAGSVCDRRLKTEICEFECPLRKIEKLEWYKFKYNPVKKLIDEDVGNGQRYVVTDRPDVCSDRQEVGVMAQELLQVGLGDCVVEEESKLGEKYYTLDDRRLQWYFNRTISSLIAWNRRQADEISRLTSEVSQLRAERAPCPPEVASDTSVAISDLKKQLDELTMVLRKKLIIA